MTDPDDIKGWQRLDPQTTMPAAFLLSDDASHVTAQSWAVDGGLLGTLKM